MPLRKSILVALSACLPILAGCGGGSNDAAKVKNAALQAKAACDVFVNFHPPAGSDANSQIDYAKATYGAFLKAADLASNAAEQDPRWKALVAAAEREAAAFEVIVKGAEGSSQLDVAAVNKAVSETAAARPRFIAECAKADPKNFTPALATSSPTPSPKATKKKH